MHSTRNRRIPAHRYTSASPRSWVGLLMLLLTIFGVQGTVLAQSPADLRSEIARLTAENTRLAQELAQARIEIHRLQSEVQRLLAPPAVPVAPSSAAPQIQSRPVITVDESRPFASPNAIERQLRESYEEAFGAQERGEPGTPERERFLRTVTDWQRVTHREMVGTVEWHMLVLEAVEDRMQITFRLQAVDPETHVPLGNPVTAAGGRSIARTYSTMAARGGLDQPLLIRGVVRPTLTIDPQRETPGPFNVPPLIGPFVQMEITMNVQSIARPRPRPVADDAARNDEDKRTAGDNENAGKAP